MPAISVRRAAVRRSSLTITWKASPVSVARVVARQIRPSSFSFKTRVRDVVRTGRLMPRQGFVSISSRERAQFMKPRNKASVAFADFGAPRSTMPSSSAWTSLRWMSDSCRIPHTAATSLLRRRRISGAVLILVARRERCDSVRLPLLNLDLYAALPADRFSLRRRQWSAGHHFKSGLPCQGSCL